MGGTSQKFTNRSGWLWHSQLIPHPSVAFKSRQSWTFYLSLFTKNGVIFVFFSFSDRRCFPTAHLDPTKASTPVKARDEVRLDAGYAGVVYPRAPATETKASQTIARIATSRGERQPRLMKQETTERKVSGRRAKKSNTQKETKKREGQTGFRQEKRCAYDFPGHRTPTSAEE